jgi:hypothetical protein
MPVNSERVNTAHLSIHIPVLFLDDLSLRIRVRRKHFDDGSFVGACTPCTCLLLPPPTKTFERLAQCFCRRGLVKVIFALAFDCTLYKCI